MPTLTEELEAVEALVRQAMHEHSQIRPRGFDSQRDRARLHRQIDALLDEHALLQLEAMAEPIRP